MSSPHRFVVRGQVYTPPDAAGVRRVLPEKYDRLATYPKAEAAFVGCAKRLAEFRRTTNPFQLGGPCLFYQTNLPAFAFHDYLLDHGLTPPPTSLTANPNYVFWWVKNNRTFTDRDREVVWAACDKLKPFEVVEEDDRKAVFVVVKLGWHQNDGCQCPKEGGFPISACGRLRDARRAASELDGVLRKTSGYEFWMPRGTRGADLVMIDEDDFITVEFTEVATIPAEGRIDNRVFVVARQSYRSEDGGFELTWIPDRHNLGARVPVVARGSKLLADERRAAFAAAARRIVNPFALCWPEEFVTEDLFDEANLDDRLLPNDLTIDDAIEIVRKLPTIPPAPEVLTADWYDRVVQWSPEFVDVIWSTFADFRLFEVVEVPLG